MAAVRGGRYGSGFYSEEDIVMGGASCEGVERRLQDCTHTTVHNCPLSRSAGVMCALNDGEYDDEPREGDTV